jgi:hypothetical protein
MYNFFASLLFAEVDAEIAQILVKEFVSIFVDVKDDAT